MYKHILIATDGSDLSQKGVAEGLELAKMMGAKVSIVTVTEPFPTYDLASKMGLFQDAAVMEKYNSDSLEIATKVLALAKSDAGRIEVPCETLHVENSVPSTAILETAKFRSCDLIVVTSHGRRGLERLVIGSQASDILLRAKIPVLVVR
jgi:nucleotide-binding universal stress UspA family protein